MILLSFRLLSQKCTGVMVSGLSRLIFGAVLSVGLAHYGSSEVELMEEELLMSVLQSSASSEGDREETWEEGNWGFPTASKSYSAMNFVTCDCSFSNNNLCHVVSIC